MKKIIIGCVVSASLLIGSVAIVIAHPDHPLENLKEMLDLNEEQTESVQKIFENSEKQREVLWKQMRTLREESRQQFEAVLNEEQLKKMGEMKEEREDFKRGHHRRGKGGHGHHMMRSHHMRGHQRGHHGSAWMMQGSFSQDIEKAPAQIPSRDV